MALFLILFFISLIALIVGLIKPTVFSRFTKGDMTRKKIVVIFGIATVVFIILHSVTNSSSKDDTQVTQQPANVDESSTPAKAEEKPAPKSKETASQKNAVRSAKNYLKFSAFSRDGLIEQLEFEEFSRDDAVYGVDNSGANWTEQATQKAKSYLEFSAFSHDGLIEQLEFEGFSRDDAVSGADSSGADWNEQAAKKAKSYLEFSAFSRDGLIDQLKFEKFTQGQAEYGATAVGL